MSNSIVGAKKKERKPRIAVDSAASISTAKLLYGLAEGEVYGLADGAKSIRLDGTPLVDDNGNGNFNGVRWTFAAGTNDQEHISGFPDVTNEIGVGVELRSDNPWIKAFNDTQLSAVRVRFKWGRLSKTNPDNGDVNGHTIKYAIDLQTDGGAYHEIINTKIQEKTSAGYERTHRIDLPKAKTGWQLRVRRLTPNDPSEYVQDTMMIEAVAEVIDVKLSYPNTALLGIEYNAEIFSSVAKIAVRVKGKIIRVPDNYDPVARTYTGIWTGNFKDAYSNNPAWVFYDLCTQWRGGLGERLDATMIDKWSLYALGQYCDQPVSDGQGGLEPRFTCNVYLQKQEEAYTVLQNIAGIFRAMSFWTGERIMLDADVPQDSIYTYSSANIVGGVAGIQYSGTRNRDRHTLAKVAWDNPNNDYQTEYEYIRDEKAMSKFGVKVLDLSAFGCTSQAQAQRAGLWALKTEQLETRQVTFSVGLDGAIPRVGNIISLSDEAFAGRANGGRVSTVNSTQRIIELDRAVTASVGDVLIINGGSGKSERRNISNVVGNRITVTAAFTSAEPEHVWAIETADLKLMRFRVMSITENDDATYAITAIQHEPQKYDAIDYGTDVKPTDITIVNPDTVDAPDTVSIESRHRVVQGQTITTLVIGWAQVSGAVAYDVEWRKDDGTWIKLPRTGNVSAEIDGVYSGNYMARVRAVSAFDVQSQSITSILTEVKGKIGLPPTVVGLTATGVLFGMDLKWGFQAGSGDAAFTEIQVGSAPDVNVATLTQVSYPTNTHTITGLQGGLSQSYRARLVDKLGFKSPWSAWVTGTTDNSVDKILDIISGEIDDSALSDALKQKIDRIDDLDDALMLETQARIDEILAANNAIQKENIDRIAAIKDATDAITAEQGARVQAITQMGEGLTTEINKNKTALEDVNERTDTLVTKTGQNLAAIQEETRLRTAEDSALSGRITTLVAQTGDNTTAITQEAEARSTEDEAQGRLITALTTRTNNAETAITAETTARTTADTAIGKRVDAIKVTADGNSGLISTETSARVAADGVLTQRIGLAEAETTKAVGRIATVEQTSSDNKAAVAKVRTDLVAEYKAADKIVNDKVVLNTAAITTESQTRATEDGALSQRIDTVTATAGANSGKIVAEEEARADADSALTQRISNAESVTSGALGRITTVEKTASDNTKAVAKARTDLTTEYSAAINALDIGGLNFLQTSDFKDLTLGKWGDTTAVASTRELNGYFAAEVGRGDAGGIYQTLPADMVDDIYTISFDARSAGGTARIRIGFLNQAGRNTTIAVTSVFSRYKATIPKTAFIDNSSRVFHVYAYAGEAFFITNIQLERGNTATSWKPSPKDLGDEVDKNRASIATVSEVVTSNTSAIATSTTTLRAEYKKAVDDIKIGGTNLYPNGQWKDGYRLYSSVNGTVSETSPFYIPSLQVTANVAGNQVYGVQTSDRFRTMEILQGETYTLSWYGIGSGTSTLNFLHLMRVEAGGNQRLPDAVISTTSSKQLNSISFVADFSTNAGYILFATRSQAVGEYFRVGNVKVEKGNKPTEYSPSPLDTYAALEEQKTVTTDINGKMEASYVLRTDVGGRVSGFGLMSNATRTDFAINADYFWIAPPTGSAKGTKPFMVLTSPKTINGTSVPAGTYIESAFIHRGSIDTLQVKDGAIKTAKIGNLQVDTLQIADFAVTIPRLREYDGDVVINNSGQPDSYTYPGGVTINSKGSGGVMVQINYQHIRAIQGYEGSGQGHELRVDIRRNSTVIKTYITPLWTTKIFDQIDIRMAALPPFLDDTPPAGDNVYTVRAYGVNTGSDKVALSLQNMTLFIMGVKK